jgi:hypothetical protein
MNFGTTLSMKRQEACPHPSRMTIRTNGMERQICEDCDHVSFAFMDEELSEVDRSRFARPVDELAVPQT